MRTIEDLEHFVLAPGETLILRSRKPLSDEQLLRMRAVVDRVLPGRPVMVLPPEMDVCAGMIEVFGAGDPGCMNDRREPTVEEVEALRRQIVAAYDQGKSVWARDKDGWFYVHRNANPHTFDWERYDYSLTAPKKGG